MPGPTAQRRSDRGRGERPSRLPAAHAPGAGVDQPSHPRAAQGLPRPCSGPAGGCGPGALSPQGQIPGGGAAGLFAPSGVDDQVDAFCQGVLWIEFQFWQGWGYGSSPMPMVFSRSAMTDTIARSSRKTTRIRPARSSLSNRAHFRALKNFPIITSSIRDLIVRRNDAKEELIIYFERNRDARHETLMSSSRKIRSIDFAEPSSEHRGRIIYFATIKRIF